MWLDLAEFSPDGDDRRHHNLVTLLHSFPLSSSNPESVSGTYTEKIEIEKKKENLLAGSE